MKIWPEVYLKNEWVTSLTNTVVMGKWWNLRLCCLQLWSHHLSGPPWSSAGLWRTSWVHSKAMGGTALWRWDKGCLTIKDIPAHSRGFRTWWSVKVPSNQTHPMTLILKKKLSWSAHKELCQRGELHIFVTFKPFKVFPTENIFLFDNRFKNSPQILVFVQREVSRTVHTPASWKDFVSYQLHLLVFSASLPLTVKGKCSVLKLALFYHLENFPSTSLYKRSERKQKLKETAGVIHVTGFKILALMAQPGCWFLEDT